MASTTCGSDAPVRARSVDGLLLYEFVALAEAANVRHALFTRHGGVSRAPFASLNLGHTVGDDLPAVEENHRRALGAMGWSVTDAVSPYQVHGARVHRVGRGHRGTTQPACDALVCVDPDVALLLRFADCVPLLFYSAARPAVGLAHAGWRGVASNIAAATVRAMVEDLGCEPAEIWAAIGPAIGPCCYCVDQGVATAVSDACPADASVVRQDGSGIWLDLPGAVRAQLEAAGVRQIDASGLCTSCRVDEFYSHRLEQGRTGRFGVAIGLLP